MSAIKGAGGQANTKQYLIQSGALGVATVGAKQLQESQSDAYRKWTNLLLKFGKKGLPAPPRPPILDYDPTAIARSVLSSGATAWQAPGRRGMVSQAAPQQPPPTTQPAPSAGWPNLDWAVETGMAIAQLVAYFRDLFRKPDDGGGFLNLSFPGGQAMPYSFLPVPSAGGGGGTDWGSIGTGISSIISAIRGGGSMPGGAMGYASSDIGSVVAGAQRELSSINTPWGGSIGGRATPRIFVVPNPSTGVPTWFRPAGRPILWSSDLSAARKVRKVAGLARRKLGGRR